MTIDIATQIGSIIVKIGRKPAVFRKQIRTVIRNSSKSLKIIWRTVACYYGQGISLGVLGTVAAQYPRNICNLSGVYQIVYPASLRTQGANVKGQVTDY